MQRRKRYDLAYLLVLLAAVGGFFLAREQARAIETPQLTFPGSVQQVITELDLFGLFTRLIPAVTPAASPTPVIPARTPEPVAVPGVEPAATPADNATATLPTSPTLSEVATAPDDAPLPFSLAGPARHSVDDCSGASIAGSIRDANGSPLAGVRLWRYDQWGNEEVTESKAGDADRGQYDFSFDDTPNIHYVQVIDAGGVIISPVIEVQHRQGEAADALCHWVDWQQR
ncbi:MAG TPA: hypothetical protein VL334_09915 [Anaerolineae bacterium]|nr:hypothetical protein [Anaerolineae bacterium]